MNFTYTAFRLIAVLAIILSITGCDNYEQELQGQSDSEEVGDVLGTPNTPSSVDANSSDDLDTSTDSETPEPDSSQSNPPPPSQTTTPALTIVSHPQSVSIFVSDSTTLSVLGSGGAGELSYQWLMNGIEVAGATSSSLTINDAQHSDSGLYSVRVSSSTESMLSFEAYVEVNDKIVPVTITQHPSPVSVNEEESFTLSVSAEGTGPLRYQWQKGGSIIPGANERVLAISTSTLGDIGSYRAIVSNAVSEAYTDFVDVWVQEKIEPPSIQAQPQSLTISEESTAEFKVDATGDGFLVYQWRKDDLPIEGAHESVFTIESTGLEDAGTYDVTVSNTQGIVSSTKAILDVLPLATPVNITLQPLTQSIYQGDTLQLSVAATGSLPISYQWLINEDPIEGANSSTLNIPQSAIDDTGIYSVIVRNSASEALSDGAFVSVARRPVTVKFNWNTPVQREDGSELAGLEIASYVIEYGYASSALDQTRTIGNDGTNSFSLNDVQTGTLFARIATIDSDGFLSQFSAIISIEIP
jgi:hypothetical protein